MINFPNAVENKNWTRSEHSMDRLSDSTQQDMIGSAQVLVIQKPPSRLTRALKEQGYVVHTVAKAAEADRKAHSARYDLVVLDLAFSGRDGLALVEKWRTNGMNGQVLMLASRRALEYKLEAFDAGADVLVMEPYDSEELLAQIRALLRRAQQSRTRLQIHDLEIDTLARAVKRAGRAITLRSDSLKSFFVWMILRD
jgi:DNA-binding response OmpR family regulator